MGTISKMRTRPPRKMSMEQKALRIGGIMLAIIAAMTIAGWIH